MYSQKLDLKYDPEIGKSMCAVNIFQLRMVRGVYKGIINATYVRICTNNVMVRLWPCDFGGLLYKNASGKVIF